MFYGRKKYSGFLKNTRNRRDTEGVSILGRLDTSIRVFYTAKTRMHQRGFGRRKRPTRHPIGMTPRGFAQKRTTTLSAFDLGFGPFFVGCQGINNINIIEFAIATPLPDIACHIGQTQGRFTEDTDGRGEFIAVFNEVFERKRALPNIDTPFAIGRF
jgi:hypothetical protein